ncbi:response regulator [Lactococcus raffinolactis]|uniref:response regulator n=1 Tax=Pseudolactococcus raffinolactis TaxID=1366 RepID=UPI00289E0FA8|nr:response regulator [Lactococcus raffinolactis]
MTKYKLYIVEDEHLIRESLKKQIRELEKKYLIELVGEAGDGEIALPEILALQPDILLTDIQMPFMTGIELSAEVRKSLPQISIIFISGFDDFSYAKAAIHLQVVEYLLKPIRNHELEQTLQKVMNGLAEKKDKKHERHEQSQVLEIEVKKNLYLNQVFKGQINTSQAISDGADFGCDMRGKKYQVILASNFVNQTFNDYAAFKDKLHGLFSENSALIFSSISSRYIKILLFNLTETELIEMGNTVTTTLISALEATNPITVGIGKVVNRISEIPASYESAQNCLLSNRQIANSSLGKYDEVIQPVLEYIDQNYANFDMSLQDVVKLTNTSSSRFSTIFRLAMGKTFIDYLTMIRIEQSKKLLRDTNASISEIATRVGYYDSNYFSAVFKRKEMISPRIYRSSFRK